MDRKDLTAWLCILILTFLFAGEPDVWDALRAKTIAFLSK